MSQGGYQVPDVANSCYQLKTFRFNSDPVNLGKARSFVADVALRCKFSEQEIFDIKLAVGEALANAIEHGSPEGPKNVITVTCHCNEDDLLIKVTDQGSFKRMLPLGTNSEADFRGRGVLLMLALMDKVSIDESENGTTVYLTKKYPHQTSCKS